MSNKFISAASSVLIFTISFFIYYSANIHSLGFADGAEFALVTKLASIAHAPGFPAYVVITWILNKLFSVLCVNHIDSLLIISNLYASLANVFIYFIYIILMKKANPQSNKTIFIISFLSVLIFSSGVTIWHWNSMIEVYSLQLLSFSGLIFGLLKYSVDKKPFYLILASVFCAIALSNHHLTMILFLPFIPFFLHETFVIKMEIRQTEAKVKASTKREITPNYFQIVLSKNFLLFIVLTFLITTVFYTWMYFRASTEIPFKFGNPDNISRLWYHLTGGSWINQTQKEVKGLIPRRIPFFIDLIYNQFFIFSPFVVLGIYLLLKSNNYKLLFVSLSYFLIVLVYQIRIAQFADTDAYMVFPFFIVSIILPFGLLFFCQFKQFLVYVIPILVFIQIYLNYSKVHDDKFNVSRDLMKSFDYSVPKNAVVLVSDWTLVSQFYYFQLIEKFRPDVIMLNYDIKFCNFKNFPLMYPNFYNSIRNPYDKFVADLGEKHPQDIYNTGCNLDSDSLLFSYGNCIKSIIKEAQNQNRPILYDPKTFVFLTQYNIIEPNAFVSGCFVSAQKSEIGKEFQSLKNFEFLNSNLIYKEPAAADKVIDILTMLEFSNKYYSAHKDTLAILRIDSSLNKINFVKQNMKKNIKFLFNQSN